MRVLVTGAAGFIGAAIALRLLERGDTVVGVDNLDPYYDVALKLSRLARLTACEGFRDVRADVSDPEAVRELMGRERPEAVVHLAARAGVRHSLERPKACVAANVTGFLHVLEACRAHPPGHLVYASSSSVYGANRALPFSVRHTADHPVSLYAATKRANELMAHCYSHLFALPTTGLRFFTVYGPWGRPDMALFRFTRNILAGRPIEVYNHGRHRRDFTYIDDIVQAVVRVIDRPASPNPEWRGESPEPGTSAAPYRVYNLGNRRAEPLERYIEVLEAALGRKAERRLLPLQPGDVPETLADVDDLAVDVHYRPDTPIEVGVQRFVEWYRDYYGDE
ncbi:MAG: SDR family NAD(P)-dependent oxidoreductase [Acidobacteria bacterium]|nr:SDR family NAD(P)-dependent oxidoreductase [Acidobacteriota bacterium]